MLRRAWNMVPLATRSALHDRLEGLKDIQELALLWKWLVSLHPLEPVPVVYAGRGRMRREAVGLLTGEDKNPQGMVEALEALALRQASVITETPMPGAIRVPSMVRTVFPVRSGRMKLQKRQRDLLAEHRTRQVTDPMEIERLFHQMLVPFAVDRHGEAAHGNTLDSVRGLIARGRLDLLLHGDEEVGVHLGYASERAGKRFWEGWRVGYPYSVYSDHRRLGDVNAINFVFALQYAEDNGFDAYDMGISAARPEGGLLQFKKRRGGDLDGWGSRHDFFFLPPPGRAPDVYWASPLFARGPDGLVLHIGVPSGKTPEDTHERYRELGYRGLASVAVHAAAELDPKALQSIEAHFESTRLEVVNEAA